MLQFINDFRVMRAEKRMTLFRIMKHNDGGLLNFILWQNEAQFQRSRLQEEVKHTESSLLVVFVKTE